MYEVAVILINYNTSNYTLQSIEKLKEHTNSKLKYQVIVVDNCSQWDDFKNLEKSFPKDDHIALYRSDINTGFGGGNMFGAKYADATYLLFLNNDAFLQNDCLSLLSDYMKAHSDVGVCTAQNYDEYNKFVPSFDHNKGLRRLLFGRGFLEATNPNRYPKRNKEYKQPIAVDWVNGAFLFFKSDVFQQIGGFDPSIFLYWEEMDLCNRLKKIALRSMLVPEAKITHVQGVSIGISEAINKESYISYLYVVKKVYGNFKYKLIKHYLGLLFLLKKKKRYLRPTVMDENRIQDSLRHQQKTVSHER